MAILNQNLYNNHNKIKLKIQPKMLKKWNFLSFNISKNIHQTIYEINAHKLIYPDKYCSVTVCEAKTHHTKYLNIEKSKLQIITSKMKIYKFLYFI